MLTCREATQLLSEKLDRPLTLQERFSLKTHTMMCPACKKFGLQMGEIRSISKQYTKNEKK